MKNTLGILAILIIIISYSLFVHKQSEFVAGEYRYFTAYEKYKADDKYIDDSAKSYEEDLYNLKSLKDNISKSIEVLEKYRQELIKYNDSISSNQNNIPDYNRYISNLKKLKINIENEQKVINSFEKELLELDNFIYTLERDLVSINMYKYDIQNYCGAIKSIDSTTNKLNLSLELIKFEAANKGIKLVEKIEKENKEEEERLNLLAHIEKQREFESQEFERLSNKYSGSLEANYSSYERSKIYYSQPTYQPILNSSSTYNYNNSYYSTNTNPNHVEVKGYTKSNGTYVAPYIRTAPNSTIKDNFSTSPNLNPYTGKIGTIRE